MTFTMAPGPHAAVTVGPEARTKLAQILASGALSAVQAPERVLPPAEADAADVDRFLATLERFKSFRDPFAPHRLFGEMPFDDYVRLHMIHCSHHLGFLAPTDAP